MSKAQWLACSMTAGFCGLCGAVAIDSGSWVALADAAIVLAITAYVVATVRRKS
jgi:hypothetical protein